ncbi:MAG: kynureninase [Gammaproteobacteria bacterium]|nr:kynureninase [Gammaproteobacteria bacterium]NNC78184.1 kynureninase [Woeseiaceae bacterium]
MSFEDSLAWAHAEDERDPLKRFRDEFRWPVSKNGYSPVYLCGNSLGLQPLRAAEYVQRELDKWGDHAVEGHFHDERPWLRFHRLAVEGFATLTGAEPSEVVAMNTLTVNLHLLMASFYRPTSSRYKIVIESNAFPSDRYAAASQIRMHGFDPDDGLLEWTPRDEDGYLDIADLESLLEKEGDSTALLLLPGVQYYTGQVLDMARICRIGRDAGCSVGLDLAHAIGNVDLALHKWAPDFAAWCTYKYLNAGPGAIAGAFVPERHCAPDKLNQLHGWWGHDEKTRFRMLPSFTPAEGAELWQMSNPPILSLAPVIASLELFLDAGMPRLREKSKNLTAYLAWLIGKRFGGRIDTISPPNERGCQLSLVVRDPAINAKALFDRLNAMNVIGDWREPDVIRVAPAPMYNNFSDVFEFAERLGTALEQN